MLIRLILLFKQCSGRTLATQSFLNFLILCHLTTHTWRVCVSVCVLGGGASLPPISVYPLVFWVGFCCTVAARHLAPPSRSLTKRIHPVLINFCLLTPPSTHPAPPSSAQVKSPCTSVGMLAEGGLAGGGVWTCGRGLAERLPVVVGRILMSCSVKI